MTEPPKQRPAPSATLGPGQELLVEVQLTMDQGMAGPHRFRIVLPAQRGDGQAQPPVELLLRGQFG